VKKIALLLFATFLSGSQIVNLLDENYNQMFDLELQKSLQEKNFDSKSWVSPIMLTWERGWSNQLTGKYSRKDTYSIGIDQPIFKSGGIYYGIKFASAKYNLAQANIHKQQKELIVKAVELLYKIKQTKLNYKLKITR